MRQVAYRPDIETTRFVAVCLCLRRNDSSLDILFDVH